MQNCLHAAVILMIFITVASLKSTSRELQNSARSNIHRNAKGQILISASCHDVKQRLNEIKEWATKTKTQCVPPQQVTSSEGNCTYDISQCIPDHVRTYHGLTGTKVGPNCWNTALVMSQILPFMRETPKAEWHFYMHSPLCKEVPEGEPLKAGDIGSIEARASNQTIQVHGFIHISDSLVYAKNGINPHSPFALQSYNTMTKIYPLGEPDGECESDCAPKSLEYFFEPQVRDSIPKYLKSTEVCQDKITPKRDEVKAACNKLSQFLERKKESCEKNCAPSKVYYYRCDTFESYFSKLSKTTQENYKKFEKLATSMECHMQPSFLHGHALTPTAKANIASAYGAILKYLDQELQKTPITEENKFLLSRLALRVQSVLDPTEFITNKKIRRFLNPDE